MTKEQLLVCDALDERDFLRKKIISAIKSAELVVAKRKRDDKINGKSVEEWEKDAKSAYQSINDMIKRYYAIDKAITQSNATTMVKTRSGVEMSRASAIAQRAVLINKVNSDSDFTGTLLKTMKHQYEVASYKVAEYDSSADREAESLRLSYVGKDVNKKLSEEDTKAIDTMVAPKYGMLVDPIGIVKEYETLADNYNTLIKEIESAIKVSNATTVIEIEY